MTELSLPEYTGLVRKLTSQTEYNDNGCYVWTGGNRNGYGVIYWKGDYFYVHKIAAHLFRRAPLQTTNINTLHKLNCKSKACWNPDHTYEGSQKDNVRDSMIAGTHSPYGGQTYGIKWNGEV